MEARILRTKQVNQQKEEKDNDKLLQDTDSNESMSAYSCVICSAFFTESTAECPLNLMVYCDKCNVGVHQSCYGYPLVPNVPKDEWICDVCQSDDVEPKCILCSMSGGAMKKTICWRWCHLQCAIWIPEAFFRCPDSNECIDILKIPKSRFGKQCCFCFRNQGATLDCCQAHCNKQYHVVCAMKQKAYFEYRTNTKSVDVIFSMCLQHTNAYRKKMKLVKD
eukprot:220522_1